MVTSPCVAQRAGENVVLSAEDGFGTAVGRESIGIYSSDSVRGFSPKVAGNVRVQGIYFDQQAGLTSRVRDGSTIRIGVAAQSDPFPAPTGIVDVSLRPSGGDNLLSVVPSWGPYGSASLELDGKLSVSESLSTAVGIAGFRDHYGNGGSGLSMSIGAVPRWRVSEHLTITGFWGRSQVFGETASPIYIPQNTFISRRIARDRYQGPSWAKNRNASDNVGIIVDSSLGPWDIKSGIFRSIFSSQRSFSNIVDQIRNDGSVERTLFANPQSRFESFSGELRVSRGLSEGPRKHLFLVSLRARTVGSRYGGSDFIDFGPSTLGRPIEPAEPRFAFTDQNRERVRQVTGGGSYGLEWGKLFDIRIGLQRTAYSKSSDSPGSPETKRSTPAWLPNITAGVHATPKLTIYGSFVRGLEENGVAPDFAANRLETLPALLTRQFDGGLQWKLGSDTSLVLGYFNISKPYVTLDTANIYRALGQETHSGIEVSLSTAVTRHLRVVAGGAFSNPVVDVPLRSSLGVGRRPVGQPLNIAQVSVDYQLPWLKGFSIDSSVNYTGKQASNLANSYFVPALTTADVGVRYRFRLSKTPATLRLSIGNILDTYQWVLVGPGAFEPLNPRSVSAYLTVDI